MQSGTLLAISSRKSVELIKQETIGSFPFVFFSQLWLKTWLAATWEVIARLQDPPKFLELEEELPEPMAWSLHFLRDNVLLVTYLDHGMMWVYVDQL